MQTYYEEDKVFRSGTISPWISIVMLIAAYIGSIFLTIALFLIDSSRYMFYLASLTGEVLLGIIPLWYVISQKVNYKEYIKLNINTKAIVYGVIFGVLMWFLGILLVNLLNQLLGPSQALEETNEIISNLVSDQIGLILMSFVMLSAGIFEEIALRGVILRSFEDRYSFILALFVSSIIFGFLHFDPQGIYIFVTFVFGILLGYIYKKYQSILVPIIAHTMNNLISLFLLALLT